MCQARQIKGTVIPWRQGTRGGLWGSAPPVLLAAERGGHLGRLQDGWGQGTHGGLDPGAGACWCVGPQDCGTMGWWGHRAYGAGGVQGDWLGGGGSSWGAVCLAGHGGSGHGAGLPGVQVPCAGSMVGCHVAPCLAGHCCDPVLSASVTCGRGPTARQHWGQPRGRVHCRSQCHNAVGSLCPSGSGHLPTCGSRLRWHGGKRRLVTMVSAALPPRLLCCQPGCRLPPCRQALLQPGQESPAPL